MTHPGNGRFEATALPGQDRPILVHTADQLEIRALRHDETVIVVDVAGEIDLASARVLDEALKRSTEIAPRVVVNLSDVNYLDSSTLNTFERAHGRLAEGATPFVVVKPANPLVSRVFEVGPLPEALVVVESLAQALAASLLP